MTIGTLWTLACGSEKQWTAEDAQDVVDMYADADRLTWEECAELGMTPEQAEAIKGAIKDDQERQETYDYQRIKSNFGETFASAFGGTLASGFNLNHSGVVSELTVC